MPSKPAGKSRWVDETPLQVLLIIVGALLFWVTWSFFTSVPSISQVKITATRNIDFPFAFSRWWDLLFLPAWLCFYHIYRFSRKRALDKFSQLRKEDAFENGVIFGFASFLISLLACMWTPILFSGWDVLLFLYVVSGFSCNVLFSVFNGVEDWDEFFRPMGSEPKRVFLYYIWGNSFAVGISTGILWGFGPGIIFSLGSVVINFALCLIVALIILISRFRR